MGYNLRICRSLWERLCLSDAAIFCTTPFASREDAAFTRREKNNISEISAGKAENM
jgi:hypothetical protein